MFGDMLYEMRYGPGEAVRRVKFPSVIHHHQGDDRLNPGHNVMEVQVSTVQANTPVQVLTPPDSAKVPPMSVATVESQKLADGAGMSVASGTPASPSSSAISSPSSRRRSTRSARSR